jgi:hypothetical protein
VAEHDLVREGVEARELEVRRREVVEEQVRRCPSSRRSARVTENRGAQLVVRSAGTGRRRRPRRRPCRGRTRQPAARRPRLPTTRESTAKPWNRKSLLKSRGAEDVALAARQVPGLRVVRAAGLVPPEDACPSA